MPKITAHPYVSWRDGRPRFTPDPRLRAAGHKGHDLKHTDGRWFTRGEAVDWSLAFVKALRASSSRPDRSLPLAGLRTGRAAHDARSGLRPKAEAATAARRLSGAPPERQPRSGEQAREAKGAPAFYTLARLFNDWQLSAKFQIPRDPHELVRARAEGSCYSPKTVREYRQKLRLIEAHDPTLAASPVDAVSQAHLVGLYDELLAAHGLASARGAMLVLSSALAWGKRRGKFAFAGNSGVNPARDLGMVQGRKRLRIGSKAEIAALIDTADALGWHDMADMIVLGLWTGQRQEDRLLLTDKGFAGGRRIFRQAKTGAIVSLAESPQLEARMKAARARRLAAGVVSPRVVLDEVGTVLGEAGDDARPGRRVQPWQPWPEDGDRYRKRFAVLRAKAARKCPSLEGGPGQPAFHEADLRATAVTWMALGGASIPEICAVTGHTLASATNILKHYLATHPEMADTAIARMVAFYESDGEAEFGL